MNCPFTLTSCPFSVRSVWYRLQSRLRWRLIEPLPPPSTPPCSPSLPAVGSGMVSLGKLAEMVRRAPCTHGLLWGLHCDAHPAHCSVSTESPAASRARPALLVQAPGPGAWPPRPVSCAPLVFVSQHRSAGPSAARLCLPQTPRFWGWGGDHGADGLSSPDLQLPPQFISFALHFTVSRRDPAACSALCFAMSSANRHSDRIHFCLPQALKMATSP